jgi:hypothetical protein
MIKDILLFVALPCSPNQSSDTQYQVSENMVNVESMPQLTGLRFNVWVPTDNGELGSKCDTERQLDPLDVGQSHL